MSHGFFRAGDHLAQPLAEFDPVGVFRAELARHVFEARAPPARHAIGLRRFCQGLVLGLAAPVSGFFDLRATYHEVDRCSRLRVLLRMELRGGTAIIHPRHLPGEPAEIGSRLGCDKQRNVFAMAGQRNIAGRVAPVLAVVEVGLVERAPLPFVDRPGIAVPEFAEFARGIIGAGDE